MFFIHIEIDDQRALHGVIVNGVVYWKALHVVTLIGYRRNTDVVRLYVPKPLRMSQLIPGGENTSCVIPKQSKMITTDQVFDLATKVKKPCEAFVELFSKILTRPLRADSKRDICHLLRYPVLTRKDPAVLHLDDDDGGGFLLTELVAKTLEATVSSNAEREESNDTERSSSSSSARTPREGDEEKVSQLHFEWEDSIPLNFLVVTTKNRKFRYVRREER